MIYNYKLNYALFNNSKVKNKLKSWRLSQTKSVKKNPK